MRGMTMDQKLAFYTQKKDSHLIWTGPTRRGIPIVCVNSIKTSVRKVYFERYYGEVNEDHLCVINTCNENLCVHPKHLTCMSTYQYATTKVKGHKATQPCQKCGAPRNQFKTNSQGRAYCVLCNRKRAIKNKKRKNISNKHIDTSSSNE